MSEQGNIAAMREALVLSRERIVETKGYYDADADKEDYETLLAAIDAVLAAPDRNCDRFGDELDAQLAFMNEEWLISVDRDSMLEKDRFENWTDEMKSAYARWLMATVKGDGHAQND